MSNLRGSGRGKSYAAYRRDALQVTCGCRLVTMRGVLRDKSACQDKVRERDQILDDKVEALVRVWARAGLIL